MWYCHKDVVSTALSSERMLVWLLWDPDLSAKHLFDTDGLWK